MGKRILWSVQEGMEEPAWMAKADGFCHKVLSYLEEDCIELSIMFCGDAFIQDLNRQYRNIDSPTDVLSFENGSEYEDEEGSWFVAGDIAISLETLPKNAEYFQVSQDEELRRLLVHGILHLLGWDHGEEHVEKDVEPVCEMLKLQKQIMEALKEETILA